MKKIGSFLVFGFFATTSLAQSGQKFASNGNSLSTGEFLGSTNNFPLNFRVANIQKMSLGVNGVLQLNTLGGTGNRLIQTDASGNILPFTMGSASQYLAGDGTWVEFPQMPLVFWRQGSSGIYFNGNVGINNPHPQYALDVTGDLNVTNNVFVGGAVLIGQKIKAIEEVHSPILYSDSIVPKVIALDSTRQITGRANFVGDVRLSNQLSVVGNATFSGNLTANNLTTSTLNLSQALAFNGGQAQIGFTAPSSSNGNTNVLSFGRVAPGQLTNACFYPINNQWLSQFPDAIQIFNQNSSSATNQNILTMGYDGINDFIDAAGINPNGNPALLINYYCGKDVAICTGSGTAPNNGGTAGGFVFTGPNVQIGQGNRDATVALSIGSKGATAIKTLDNSGNTNFLLGSDGTVSFGRDQSGACRVPAGFQMAVFGKIITKEVVVKLEPWPDYVFKSNYVLKDLFEVEKFIKQNQHLPNIPSAQEVQASGVQLGEMVGKQMEKIEELTLYLIEMKKEIEILKKENENLKAAVRK